MIDNKLPYQGYCFTDHLLPYWTRQHASCLFSHLNGRIPYILLHQPEEIECHAAAEQLVAERMGLTK